MKQRHTVLVVEDDSATAEDLLEILRSIECESVVCDNHDDALSVLRNRSFCLVLLDLQIKGAPDSIKGHVEHGKALLRKIRLMHGEHYGTVYWLPILIVSGFARERDEAIEVMKEGASDVIQKPLISREVSEKIRDALAAAGRQLHEHCGETPSAQRLNVADGVVIAIPGEKNRRRTRITVAAKAVDLTDASIKVLLHLMLAQLKQTTVNKVDLGATADQGFKGISILRNELKPALGGIDIIKNHYHGNYSFTDVVTIGECAFDKLLDIGDATISALATELQRHLQAGRGKV
jgi:DNA-binding response OmpR family regulator